MQVASNFILFASRRAASFKLSLDDVLKKTRQNKRYAAPSNLKEEDPIAGHM